MRDSTVEPGAEDRGIVMRAVTLAEVAERAGVSKMAVSRVLNPSSASKTRVSEATRERILEAAAAMRYTPNAVAQSLRRKKTDVFAFYNAQNVAFNPTYPFYAAILEGVQGGCSEHQKDLLIHAKFAGRSDDDIVEGLRNGQIDGLVLHVRTITPLVRRLAESHLPIVTLGERVDSLPHVAIDEDAGGQLLARHLADKGYKRILYRSLQEQSPAFSHLQRKNAFCEYAQRLGMEVSHSADNPTTNWPTPEEAALLLSPERPEVVVCWSDVSADILAEFFAKHGIRVPQDVALVGFDGLNSSRRPALHLTTIKAPWKLVARTAVGILAAQCKGEDVPMNTVLPVELIEGRTT